MSQETLRPARPADLDRILDIESRWATTPGWNRSHFEQELSSGRSYFAVIEREGPCVRSCSARTVPGAISRQGLVCGYAVLWKVPPEAQLLTIAVAPEAARCGFGRKLLSHLIETCRSLDFQKVTLEVSAANVPARRLYESAGFRVVGRRPKFYNDGSDAILMDLPLP